MRKLSDIVFNKFGTMIKNRRNLCHNCFKKSLVTQLYPFNRNLNSLNTCRMQYFVFDDLSITNH